MRREFTFLVGQQHTGKTYQMIRAIKHYEQRKRIRCTFVVDPHGEMARLDWQGHDVALCRIEADFYEECAKREDQIPRIVLMSEPAAAYRLCIEIGNCVLVVDEAYNECPAGSTWRGDDNLKTIVLRGRHIVAADGKQYPCQVIMACQYPRSVHLLIYEQAEAVLCSKLRGEQARGWVRAYAGEDALEQTDNLEELQWAVVTGRRPPWF